MKQAAALLIAALCLPVARAEDWPRWRGPDLNGISREKGWLDQWPKDGPPVVWKAEVGVGFSSVAVAQGRLYTMGHKDGKDTVICLDALTGKPVWSHSYNADLGDLNFEGGPAATPTVHDGAVYTLSRWGDLFCFDAAKGTVRWSRNLVKEDNARIPTWGFSGSSLVHEKRLLLNVGKAGMALEKDTGKPVWSSGDEEAGYSTPIPCQRGKDSLALVSSGAGFTAVNIATGKAALGIPLADPLRRQFRRPDPDGRPGLHLLGLQQGLRAPENGRRRAEGDLEKQKHAEPVQLQRAARQLPVRDRWRHDHGHGFALRRDQDGRDSLVQGRLRLRLGDGSRRQAHCPE